MTTVSPVLNAMMNDWNVQPTVRLENVVFASDPDANLLVKHNLVAFLMAAAIDRGGQSFALWNVPWKLKQEWGHLDVKTIQNMDEQNLMQVTAIAKAPAMTGRRDLAKTIISVARIVERDHNGNAEGLFAGSIPQIIDRLQKIHGVGPGIARMMVIQRLLYFGLSPDPGGRLLPKIDVHIRRVFQRSGQSCDGSDAAIALAVAGLSAHDVAVVDQVCWKIGKSWCHSNTPACNACILSAICPKNDV